MEWIRTHFRANVPEAHIRSLTGLKVTDVHRTLLELGGFVSETDLEEALHVAITKGLTSAGYLRRRLDRHGARGRRGIQVIRRVLEDIEKAGGVPQSRFESRLLRLLRSSRLPVPVPQYEILDDDGVVVARPDFVYPGHRVVIEAFSYEWHGRKQKSLDDARRRNRLGALGWVVLDIAWKDLLEHPDEVMAMIASALGIRTLEL